MYKHSDVKVGEEHCVMLKIIVKLVKEYSNDASELKESEGTKENIDVKSPLN